MDSGYADIINAWDFGPISAERAFLVQKLTGLRFQEGALASAVVRKPSEVEELTLLPLNVVYAVVLLILSPWLIYKGVTTGKYRRGLWTKLTGRLSRIAGERSCVWFHGVSVGEVHLLTQVVAAFRQRHPDWECVISTTTDTGFAEAKKRFPGTEVLFWPLDFTWAVHRALRQIRPNVVVLAESEIWPNFVRIAKNQGVKLALINARMSPRSLRRYEKFRWLTTGIVRSFDLIATQTDEYADAFRKLGATKIHTTGSVKFDGIQFHRDNSLTLEMRQLLGLREDDLIWVAGSTQTPEERVALEIFQEARRSHDNLRLVIVPRQKERFVEVSDLLVKSGVPFLRRSDMQLVGENWPGETPVILVDTIGDLRTVWGMADVAFVGGSLDGKRGGQNMIEPAAYGAAVVFGPHVWNFKKTARQLVEHQAAIQVEDAAALKLAILRLLSAPDSRRRLGQAAQAFVVSQQGATERTLDALEPLLGIVGESIRAA